MKYKMLPNYLIDIVTNTNEIHDYSTRQSEFNFALPKKSFSYSTEVLKAKSIFSFKTKMNYL